MKVRAHLNKYFSREFGDLNDVRVFFPVRKMFERRMGRQLVTDQPILPGYLMVSTEQVLDTRMLDVERLPGSYGFLRNMDNTICLRASDKEYAAWIMGNDGVIKPSKISFTEGEPIKVLEGPLMNLHGTIVRVDRRGSRVMVEFDFAGVVRRVSMPVEFIGAE